MQWTFTSVAQAYTFANILGRMTGDPTRVHSFKWGEWRVERFTGTRWVNA